MKKLFMVVLMMMFAIGAADAAVKLSYVDLVKSLTDLEALAALPPAGEKCQQWSSYDRASRYDEKTGTYVAWDANDDGVGIVRTEGDKQVLAEMEGPGCIWRIWSALPGQAHVRIYLDGAADPTVDLPFSGYFDLKNPPFTYPALVHDASSGKNCYVPIPFQKSCKIVADKDWGAYYHFTYTTYPKGTVLPTFKRDLSPEETAALAAADRFLSENLGTDPAGKRKGEIAFSKPLIIPAKGDMSIAVNGRRAITALKVKLDPGAIGDAAKALREVVMRIYWDGEKSPSVCAPLGDFFGAGPGINTYRSLPLGMLDDGTFYSFWYMPFTKKAEIEFSNDGDRPFPMELSITHAPISKSASRTMGRFHAQWHLDAFLPTEPERWIDWPMLKTTGRGRFCGVVLNIWNPKGGWWGEGDEKFFVDGEKFPSTFGTGSEDYFGYAWGNPALFQNAYHNQTISEGNAGNISVNRWHITDNVPFQKSFEGCIEKYWPNKKPTQYSCVAYWYLAPGGGDPYDKGYSVEERTSYRIQPQVYGVPGAIEGESLEVVEVTGGETQIQELDERYSGEKHLWWTGAKPGDKLVLAIPVNDAGTYELEMQLTKAVDYGIVQLSLDGVPLGGPIDLYNDGVIPTGPLSFGRRELSAGTHRLTVEITGANEKAVKAYMFGLDYVKLEPAN